VLGGRRHVGSPLQCAKAPCGPRRGRSSRQHNSAGTRSPILEQAKSAELELCRRPHRRGVPASLARPRRSIRREADWQAVVSGLVRGGLILCPQRDSNPCCRLERAEQALLTAIESCVNPLLTRRVVITANNGQQSPIRPWWVPSRYPEMIMSEERSSPDQDQLEQCRSTSKRPDRC
jgi:hypothetical protein